MEFKASAARVDQLEEENPAQKAWALRDTWNEHAGDVTLNIIRVDAIARVPGQKKQDFTSGFFPSIHEGA